MLGRLVKAAQQAKEAKEKLGKLEVAPEPEEPEQQVPGTPELTEATPTTTPTTESGRTPRRSNSGRLHRQERSVREGQWRENVCCAAGLSWQHSSPLSDGDDVASVLPPPPAEAERPSRTSLTELDDAVPPLVSRDKFSGAYRSNSRKTLLTAYSDADSAVSMVSQILGCACTFQRQLCGLCGHSQS